MVCCPDDEPLIEAARVMYKGKKKRGRGLRKPLEDTAENSGTSTHSRQFEGDSASAQAARRRHPLANLQLVQALQVRDVQRDLLLVPLGPHSTEGESELRSNKRRRGGKGKTIWCRPAGRVGLPHGEDADPKSNPPKRSNERPRSEQEREARQTTIDKKGLRPAHGTRSSLSFSLSLSLSRAPAG